MKLYGNTQVRQQRSSMRRHTSEWERQATQSVEPRYRGGKRRMSLKNTIHSSVARIEVHGRGWLEPDCHSKEFGPYRYYESTRSN